MKKVVALGRVVDLVEDLAGRVAQADQSECAGEEGDDGRADPRERTVVRQLRGQAGDRQVPGNPKVGYTQLYGAPGTAGVSILSR